MTSIKPDSAEAAEQAFYAAFAAADARAMRQLWEESAEVVCAHPMGAAIQGFEPIMESFAQIFANGPRMRFTVDRVSLIAGHDLAVSVVYEHIHGADATTPHPPILATNIFRRGADGWRLVLHQASPAVLGEEAAAQRIGVLH